MYQYEWLDKVTQITEGGKVIRSFRYHTGDQLTAVYDCSSTESFLWDGLALIHRGGTSYINEPYVTGGNPILADNRILFNDMLGSTLGSHSDEGYTPVRMTAFGESDNADAFFTGKPLVGELGYTFLFRNYRPEQGKWQTTDPLGYPDGWNNLAYVNNGVTLAIDQFGGWETYTYTVSRHVNFGNEVLDGILIPPDFATRPDGTSFWDIFVSLVDDALREELLNEALNNWLTGPNPPDGINNYNEPPSVDFCQALTDANIAHSECRLVSVELVSADFDVAGMSSGRMVYGADQTWKVTGRYE